MDIFMILHIFNVIYYNLYYIFPSTSPAKR